MDVDQLEKVLPQLVCAMQEAQPATLSGACVATLSTPLFHSSWTSRGYTRGLQSPG